MTDADLMDADCVHGITWWSCDECSCVADTELSRDDADVGGSESSGEFSWPETQD